MSPATVPVLAAAWRWQVFNAVMAWRVTIWAWGDVKARMVCAPTQSRAQARFETLALGPAHVQWVLRLRETRIPLPQNTLRPERVTVSPHCRVVFGPANLD